MVIFGRQTVNIIYFEKMMNHFRLNVAINVDKHTYIKLYKNWVKKITNIDILAYLICFKRKKKKRLNQQPN